MFDSVQRAVCGMLIALAISIVLFGVYLLCAVFSAYRTTKETEKVDFFTCDKHGAFPVKLLMEIDLQDGRPPVKQCPFCYEEAFRKAEERLKSQEISHVRK